MLNTKTFHKLKESIDLFSVNVDEIVVSDKFKHNNKEFKDFIGYQDGLIKPLCIILPQMSKYMKSLKAKVREYDGVIKTHFLGNDMPKGNMHYTCIACITIDSVLRIYKENYPQVYLEECK